MNKFLLIAVLALATVAVAQEEIYDDTESQLSLVPSNDEEVSGLEGKSAAFADFCVSARDYVISDIRRTSNGLAANVFTLFFNSAEQIGESALNTQKEATSRIGNQIRNPEAQIGANGDDEIDNMILDGQHRVQDAAIQPKSLLQAVMSTLQATGNAVSKNVIGRLNAFKESLGLAQVTGALLGACDQVHNYEQKLSEQFNEARDALAAKDPSMASISFNQVNCITTKRIVRLDSLCNIGKVTHAPLMRMMGRN